MIQKNDQPPKLYKNEYSTDVLARETIDMLDDAVAAGKPFFLTAAPIAPHTGAAIGPDGPYAEAPTPADRHKHLYPGVQVPRTDNFNPDVASGTSWIADLPIIGETELAYNDLLYRRRLQSLAAVDDMVEEIVNRLGHHGILDNTYLIFTSDQGFHIGQHRMPPGKCTSFEEDINVPMVIRGPGVPVGRVSEIVTTHTDLAPTILSMLELSCDHNLDGVAMPYTEPTLKEEEMSLVRQEHVNVEFWGQPYFEGRFFNDCKCMILESLTPIH
jgi:N-acetylglucosamine-6-sulfatase